MTEQQLGRYRLLGVLGKGAMGIVYEARDPHLDRLVAVKTIRLANATEEQAANYERRFLTEARSAARLRHPAIVNVYDAGHDNDVTYLVMEKVNGVNLKHCLNEGVRLSMAGIVRTLLDVLGALDHAHQHRIVHRDVKPENILIDATGAVKLTDFGIAKIQEDGADNGTQLSGAVIGTPRYMSPEQISGMPVDHRTDVFSAGVLLYELLTGRMPFDGPHPMAVANAIIHHTPTQPSALNPAIWPALDAVVAQALAKRPEDRYPSASAFAGALRNALQEGGALHTPLPPKLVSAEELVDPASAQLMTRLLQRTAAPGVQATPAPARAEDNDPTRVATRPSVFANTRAPRPAAAPAEAPLTATHRGHQPMGLWLGGGALVLAAAVLAWLWREPAAAPAPRTSAEVPLPPAPSTTAAAAPESQSATPAKVDRAPPAVASPAPPPAASPTAPAHVPVTAPAVPLAKPKPPSAVAVEASAPQAPAPAPSTREPQAPPPAKTDSAKCSRLLEKASSGEPLSALEQKDLLASCR